MGRAYIDLTNLYKPKRFVTFCTKSMTSIGQQYSIIFTIYKIMFHSKKDNVKLYYHYTFVSQFGEELIFSSVAILTYFVYVSLGDVVQERRLNCKVVAIWIISYIDSFR